MGLTWQRAKGHLLPIITKPTNIQLQVKLETMAEITSALPMLPHKQKISQMVPGIRLEDTPGKGETPDSMTGGNDCPIPNLECGSPLKVQSAHTNQALGRLQHLDQCHCCLTSSPYPSMTPKRADLQGQVTDQREMEFSLPVPEMKACLSMT